MSEDRPELCGITTVIPHSTNLLQGDTSNPQSVIQRAIPQQADSDDQLVGLWLHGRSVHTQKSYRRDMRLFRNHCQKNLKDVLLADLHNYADSLVQNDLAPVSIKRILSSIKSLFSYGHRIGYFLFDVGKPLRIPSSKDSLSERILSEQEIQTLIQSTTNPRNQLMLKVFYYTGLRSYSSDDPFVFEVPMSRYKVNPSLFFPRLRTPLIMRFASARSKLRCSSILSTFSRTQADIAK